MGQGKNRGNKMKDTLSLYDELLAGGCTEAQARVQAHQLGDVSDVTKDIKNELLWLRIIGGAMTLSFFSNFIFK
jgi:hypothetical protein